LDQCLLTFQHLIFGEALFLTNTLLLDTFLLLRT
jgi:hypothetical protein